MYRCKECGESIDEYQYDNHYRLCPICLRQHLKNKGVAKEKSKKINFFLISGLILATLYIPVMLFLLFPYHYVGVNEGSEFSWEYHLYEEEFEHLEADTGIPSSAFLSGDIDYINLKIESIRLEDTYDVKDYYKNETYKNKIGTKLLCEMEFVYGKGEGSETETDDGYEHIIFKYNKDVYSTLLIFGSLIIAADVDFAEAAEEIEDFYEDEGEDVSIDVYTHGISITFEETDTVEEIKVRSYYTSFGVLKYFYYYYDSDTVMSFKNTRDTELTDRAQASALYLGLIALTSIFLIIIGFVMDIKKVEILDNKKVPDKERSSLKGRQSGVNSGIVILVVLFLMLEISLATFSSHVLFSMVIFFPWLFFSMVSLFPWLVSLGIAHLLYRFRKYFKKKKIIIEHLSKEMDEDFKNIID